MLKLNRKFNKHTFQLWVRNAKSVCKQLIIPITVVQAIRTIFLPTTFDVLLLTTFIIIALAFHYEFI